MKHYGDITRMKGGEIEPVWLITGGSPCQDLSVAGKRAGLAGERSGLFMEMIRIIKEMRAKDGMDRRADELIRPRFVLWENVPGALSSNNGEDFRCVIEEFCRVKDETVTIPRPPKGKWANAGHIVGDGWSLAWRIRDAQYWGVPQRRRRIALLVDYSGMDAGKIVFEQRAGGERGREVRSLPESLRGDTEPGGEEGQGASDGPPGGVGESGACSCGLAYTLKIRGGCRKRLPREQSGQGAADTDGAFGDARREPGSDAVRCMNPWDGQTERVYAENGIWHSLFSNSRGGQSRDAVLSIGWQRHEGEPPRPRMGGEDDPMFTLNGVERHAVAVIVLNDQGGRR